MGKRKPKRNCAREILRRRRKRNAIASPPSYSYLADARLANLLPRISEAAIATSNVIRERLAPAVQNLANWARENAHVIEEAAALSTTFSSAESPWMRERRERVERVTELMAQASPDNYRRGGEFLQQLAIIAPTPNEYGSRIRTETIDLPHPPQIPGFGRSPSEPLEATSRHVFRQSFGGLVDESVSAGCDSETIRVTPQGLVTELSWSAPVDEHQEERTRPSDLTEELTRIASYPSVSAFLDRISRGVARMKQLTPEKEALLAESTKMKSCFYFSEITDWELSRGHLKCAVNPTSKCSDCSLFEEK